MMFSPAKDSAHGMLLGKFMPPHLGHVYLGDFARNFVSDLSIVVGTLPSEPIPGDIRYRWMRTLFPNENVIHLDKVLPQDPSEHPDFWKIWYDALCKILPATPDYVFASETYGYKLAEIFGAQFIPVDRSRSIRPISGTAVRDRPLENWDLLPQCVKPYFAKRVCVFGPESTGKSTLAQHLARHFQTIAVPEYARTYLEEQNGELSILDIPHIARGQIASEESLAPYCNKVLITDTDALETVVWSNFLYKECPSWIKEAADQRPADLYLLTNVDVPWIKDEVRYLPNNRADFHQQCEAALKAGDRRYIHVSGDWDSRWRTAVSAVEELIAEAPRIVEWGA